MFVDRETELAWLEERWRSAEAQLLIMYGKRRVGKTALLKEFIREKPAVYVLADRRPEREQLKEVTTRLGAHLKDAFIGRKGFESWLEAFEYMQARLILSPGERSTRGRLALVLDEYPYLGCSRPCVSICPVQAIPPDRDRAMTMAGTEYRYGGCPTSAANGGLADLSWTITSTASRTVPMPALDDEADPVQVRREFLLAAENRFPWDRAYRAAFTYIACSKCYVVCHPERMKRKPKSGTPDTPGNANPL